MMMDALARYDGDNGAIRATAATAPTRAIDMSRLAATDSEFGLQYCKISVVDVALQQANPIPMNAEKIATD
jgi:hypothetical protein